MKKYIFLLVTLFFGITIQAQSYKVIVNKSNLTSTLNKKEVSNFLLKKKTKWPDGQKVAPIDQKANSDVRKSFTDAVHKKSVSAIKSYWQQSVFAGKATPPLEKANDIDIVNFVIQNQGAIGYVTADADVTGVKELNVTD